MESRETVGKRPVLLSNFLAAGGKTTGSKLPSPQRKEKGALALEMCRIWCTLVVMFEAYLRPGEMLSLRPSSFLAPTEGGVRRLVILLFPQVGTARSRNGEADDTISLDSKRCLWVGRVFERLRRRQPHDKPLLNLSYAQYALFHQ